MSFLWIYNAYNYLNGKLDKTMAYVSSKLFFANFFFALKFFYHIEIAIYIFRWRVIIGNRISLMISSYETLQFGKNKVSNHPR